MGRSDPKKRSNGATPYQRFEDLTKRLLSVPKDEVREAERKRRKGNKPR